MGDKKAFRLHKMQLQQLKNFHLCGPYRPNPEKFRKKVDKLNKSQNLSFFVI